MAAFTTRVELHDAQPRDYNALHAEMEREGFARTITSDDGTQYRLPPAEYNYEGNLTAVDVRNKAKRAASRVKDSYEVLVTKSAARAWYNLTTIS